MSIDLNREKLKALANELGQRHQDRERPECAECRAAENDR